MDKKESISSLPLDHAFNLAASRARPSDSTFIKSIKLNNFLSFGPNAQAVELRNLNILIGANGSGKSNFLEAFDVLRSTPKDIQKTILQGGGIQDWLWKDGGSTPPTATIEAIVNVPKTFKPLRYSLSFTEKRPIERFSLVGERIESESPQKKGQDPYIFYQFLGDHGLLNQSRNLTHTQIDINTSILSQYRDPESSPQLAYLTDELPKIQIYRNWGFGRKSPAREPQKSDMPQTYLLEDGSNLGLVLNYLRTTPAKHKIINHLNKLYEGIDDFDVIIAGGTLLPYLREGDRIIPANRLSDGTLQFLCLLAILCNPNPAKITCIEEPELGLHPDAIATVAELLIEASARTQLIVTTHSDGLVDCMTEQPEAVITVERDIQDGTTLKRLQKEQLAPWLERYRLAELWQKGKIGGNRW